VVGSGGGHRLGRRPRRRHDAALNFLQILLELKFLLLQLLDFVFEDDCIFAFDVDLFIVLEEAGLVLGFQVGQLALVVPEVVLEARDAHLVGVDAVDPAFEDVDGVADDLGEGAHGGLAAAVGLGLPPKLADDLRAEIAIELAVGLLVEDAREFVPR
jgi:hypothetical protein